MIFSPQTLTGTRRGTPCVSYIHVFLFLLSMACISIYAVVPVSTVLVAACETMQQDIVPFACAHCLLPSKYPDITLHLRKGRKFKFLSFLLPTFRNLEFERLCIPL